MTGQDKRSFERFLEESFRDNITLRELRLSDNELQYLVKLMPKAEVRDMPDPVCSDGKRWYEVSLR